MITTARSRSGPFEDVPNTWKPLNMPDGSHSATYVCPNGHNGLLDAHKIDTDGVVTPSVVCEGYPAGFRFREAPAEPCTFHDFLKLDGWPTNNPE